MSGRDREVRWVSRHLSSTSGLMGLAFCEANESRVRYHFLCVHKTPGDKVEGPHASKLPKRTRPWRKGTANKSCEMRQKPHGQHHRERLWKSQYFSSKMWASCSIWFYCQPGRICFLRGLVCFNLSVLLFPLQFLLHST